MEVDMVITMCLFAVMEPSRDHWEDSNCLRHGHFNMSLLLWWSPSRGMVTWREQKGASRGHGHDYNEAPIGEHSHILCTVRPFRVSVIFLHVLPSKGPLSVDIIRSYWYRRHSTFQEHLLVIMVWQTHSNSELFATFSMTTVFHSNVVTTSKRNGHCCLLIAWFEEDHWICLSHACIFIYLWDILLCTSCVCPLIPSYVNSNI